MIKLRPGTKALSVVLAFLLLVGYSANVVTGADAAANADSNAIQQAKQQATRRAKRHNLSSEITDSNGADSDSSTHEQSQTHDDDPGATPQIFQMQDDSGIVRLIPAATKRSPAGQATATATPTNSATVPPATATLQPQPYPSMRTSALPSVASAPFWQALVTRWLSGARLQRNRVAVATVPAPSTATVQRTTPSVRATATVQPTSTAQATATTQATASLPAPTIEQATILSVSQIITAMPGTSADVTAYLLTQASQPVTNQEVILLIDTSDVQHNATDQEGAVHFRLSNTLPTGDHALKLLFVGNESLRAAATEAVLHYHVARPGGPDTRRSDGDAAAPAGEKSVASLGQRSVGLQASSLLFVSLLSHRAMAHPLGALLALTLLVGIAWVASPTFLGRGSLAAPRRSKVRFGHLAAWRIPLPLWYGVRVISVGSAISLAIVLLIRPQTGLFVFWRLLIPNLPLLFFIAPSLWRNICPMAALNQTPRLFHFSRSWTLPKWMQRYGYLVAISLFLVLVVSRKLLFNQNGPALAILILCSLSAAFVMGNFFKGKSGWCSSICPLLPVQRIYGQTPFVKLEHAHCQPCLGCTKNCYDLSPTDAYLADLFDEDRQFAGLRRAFVALFPGFVLAFYLLPNPPAITVWQMIGGFVVAAAISLVSFFVLSELLNVKGSKITVLYGAAALNAYYWFNSVGLGSLIASPAPDWFVWPFRTLVFGLTLFWIYRTYRKERAYIELTLAPQTFHSEFRTMPAGQSATKDAPTAAPSQPEVTIMPEGTRLTVEPNRTLLEIIERNNLPIESGCRMGLCGADPICVHEGMECLSKVGSDERKTLERLALPPNTRMACMARVRGNVKIGLTPAKPDIYQSSVVSGFRYDKSVQRVVIVGNGIAGVTAADHIRRRHPHCEIHLIGRERHHLYNRMGITRLIYGRSAMQGLYLLPDQWYDDFNITCWLNTHVTEIDAVNQSVSLGTGEMLPYDRLILTTGSQSFVPPIAGYGVAGSFVLRSADDAMAIRAYVQEERSKRAVIAGGGLLGLEAAYALHKLGLEVTVLERSAALLTRQLDGRSGEFLRAYLENMGIHVLMESEVDKVLDSAAQPGRMQQIELKQGEQLDCDLLLVAAGIAPDVELARSCGLRIKRAVCVDAQMRTSDPHIFAAGDVAEYDEKVYGLWPVAVSQAEVAAASAVAAPGATLSDYAESAPVTMLKVAGIDVTSIGRIKAQGSDEEEIVLEDHVAHRYRKLVIAQGKAVGAILLDAQQDAPGVTEAIKQQIDIENDLELLRMGNWESLQRLV